MSSASSHRCSPRSRSGSKDDEPLDLDHTSPRELGPDGIGSRREHDLGSGGLCQAEHLHERDDRRRVHARHAAEIDHQEPRRRGHLQAPSDPLQQAVGRSEEDEPVHPQDLDTVRKPAELVAFRRGPIDVAAVRLAESDLVHQVDPTVADREQHGGEHDADHDPDQEPPDDDRCQDREHDGVLERREQPPLVPDPLDDERQPEEHQHTPDDHPRDQPDDLRADHDGGQRDERRDEPGGPRVHAHVRRERRERKASDSRGSPRAPRTRRSTRPRRGAPGSCRGPGPGRARCH